MVNHYSNCYQIKIKDGWIWFTNNYSACFTIYLSSANSCTVNLQGQHMNKVKIYHSQHNNSNYHQIEVDKDWR